MSPPSGCLALCGLILAAGSWAGGQDAGLVRTLETRSFLIAGADAESVLYVARMARRAEERWEAAFAPVPESAPLAFISLRMAATAGSDSGDPVAFEHDGIDVGIVWSPALRRTELSRALATAWWRRAALYATGASDVPDWLVTAAAALLEVEVNPLFRDRILPGFESEANQAPPLDHVLGIRPPARRSDSGENGWTAPFVLVEALMPSLNRIADPAERLAAWLGIRGAESLGSWLREPTASQATDDVRKIWARVWEEARQSGRGPYWSLSRSSWELEKLQDRIQSTGTGALLDSVSPEVAEASIQDVRRVLPRINPVFHNALLSLGRALEAIVAEDSVSARDAFDLFRRDFRQAEVTADEIRDLLSHAEAAGH